MITYGRGTKRYRIESRWWKECKELKVTKVDQWVDEGTLRTEQTTESSKNKDY